MTAWTSRSTGGTRSPATRSRRSWSRAVRENTFVIAVCTPRYKERSDRRGGGVGYEGDIMTAKVFISGNHRKCIPILRRGTWAEAAPSWLLGKYYIDLRGDPYPESRYEELLRTLHGDAKRRHRSTPDRTSVPATRGRSRPMPIRGKKCGGRHRPTCRPGRSAGRPQDRRFEQAPGESGRAARGGDESVDRDPERGGQGALEGATRRPGPADPGCRRGARADSIGVTPGSSLADRARNEVAADRVDAGHHREREELHHRGTRTATPRPWSSGFSAPLAS